MNNRGQLRRGGILATLERYPGTRKQAKGAEGILYQTRDKGGKWQREKQLNMTKLVKGGKT